MEFQYFTNSNGRGSMEMASLLALLDDFSVNPNAGDKVSCLRPSLIQPEHFHAIPFSQDHRLSRCSSIFLIIQEFGKQYCLSE